MKKFIVKLLVFFLPIFITSVFMEVLLRNVKNDYLIKKEFLDVNCTSVETLILGSSHAFYGINPDFFTSYTFNASYISQSLDYDLEILKKYQSKLTNLKHLVLPISYFTLFDKLEKGAESWRVKNYVIYYGMETSNSIFDHTELLSNKASTSLRKFVSFYLKGNSNISCNKSGWGINYISDNAQDLFVTGREAAYRHSRDDIEDPKTQAILKDNLRILNCIENWCKARDVKLLLITLPAYETYSQNLHSDQLKITIEAARCTDLKNSNCIYMNLLYDTSFVARDFYDADHLSEIGAKKLSVYINKEIISWE